MKQYSTIRSSIRRAGVIDIHVPPMPDFDLNRYTGHWYEIARLDHFFERGLARVTANYTRREDGKILVINRGYDPVQKCWKENQATAIQQKPSNYFRVYFIPLIGGAYRILGLDKDYKWAVISGGRSDYLWFLSRMPSVSFETWDTMVEIARNSGYNIAELIPVSQGAQPPSDMPENTPSHRMT